jgi:hypothetical protein
VATPSVEWQSHLWSGEATCGVAQRSAMGYSPSRTFLEAMMSEAVANKQIEIDANKEKIKAHLRATMPAFDPTMTNAAFAAMWPIDVEQDPYSVPLEAIDVGHPALFEADAMWPYFERLRNEAPVHYCAKSQFGPYWSLTKFATFSTFLGANLRNL